ncbi:MULTISPECIES: serine--tRNA ligase [unclassified Aureispira]|uniref:serine--tRNA ligase n=1 Tax=unclassified Aureispira TaxID=2649989 RepID=UPI0006976FBD|nr:MULTISPECIES: serine--tRNA ligase [unclassified Aureispira]WMX15376.1 serine--tRNA ligase [Aureispira sp. CCB-E]
MLPVSFIREHKEKVIKSLEIRNFTDFSILDQIIQVDSKRKSLQKELDEHLAEGNKIAAEIKDLYKTGRGAEAEGKKKRGSELKTINAGLKHELTEIKAQLEDLMLQVPNCANEIVPPGNSDEDNQVQQDWGQDLPEVSGTALPHWELAKKYNLIDFELGAKITGAGFPVYIGKGARLQRALISFFLDEAQDAGYIEHQVPYVVNEDSARGTGQLPDKEGQMYHIGNDDLYLIPTAEVPLTNIYRDVILKEKDFPVKLTGHTPCFRREAGSYGAHVRGLNRLHQFEKVELVQIQHPEKSYDTLTEMCNHVEGLLKKLELPYRILLLCGGDLGFTSALTYDFETYSAAQKRWLEVSSVSNFETFQANRLKLRYKGEDGKNHLAHTLNGSALALPRIIATLLENNQTEDGIKIPKVLQKYTGFDMIK